MTDKLMKVEEHNGLTVYRIACSCGHQEHDVSLYMSWDQTLKDYGFELNLDFNPQPQRPFFHENWFYRLKWKIGSCWKILTGTFEARNDIMLDAKNIDAFMEVLTEAKKKIEEFKNGRQG